MGYVEDNLIKQEEIIYRAKIHWFIYGSAIACFMMGVSSSKAENGADTLFFLLAAAFFLYAFITQRSTELVVTNKRVIGKFGFIRRDTIEILHQKIESVKVKQGIFGRMFDYGDVIIQGSGGASSPIKFISKPLEFRKQAMEHVDLQSSK